MPWISRVVGFLLVALPMTPSGGYGQAHLSSQNRLRLAEVKRLADQLRGRVWLGWPRMAMPILLVTETTEFLVGHARPSTDFTPSGYDSLLHADVWSRPRQFPPTLLATFPAVGGVATIVVGSAEQSDKPPTAWVLTVLHEHFHQWQ